MKTKIRTRLGAVLSLLVTIAVSATTAAQSGTINGLITFNSYVPGTIAQVYTMNQDGTGATQLTKGATSSVGPTWHPSRQYISFFRDGYLMIMPARPEGGSIRPFAVGLAQSVGAGFSPDGTQIVYTGTIDAQHSCTITRTVDVAKKKVGPAQIAWIGLAFAPSYTPDGRKILFSSQVDSPDGAPHVKLLDLATGAITSYNSINGYCPASSPDGRWIAFSSNLPDGSVGLYMTSLDGSQLVQVTSVPSPGSLAWVSFSDDQTQIAFGSNPDGELPKTDNMSIYKVNIADGIVTFLLRSGNAPRWWR